MNLTQNITFTAPGFRVEGMADAEAAADATTLSQVQTLVLAAAVAVSFFNNTDDFLSWRFDLVSASHFYSDTFWNTVVVGNGSILLPATPFADANHPGKVMLTTDTDADEFTLYKRGYLVLDVNDITFEAILVSLTSNDIGQETTLRIGLGQDSITHNGAYFLIEKNPADAAFYLSAVTMVADTPTTTAISTITGNEKLRIEYIGSSGDVEFYVDDVLAATHSTPDTPVGLATPMGEFVSLITTTSMSTTFEFVLDKTSCYGTVTR